MVSTVDTNLIARSNRETQLQVTEEIKEILERNPYPEEDMLEILDRAFISKNFRPEEARTYWPLHIFCIS
ncbi:triphosphoribosyl-dephospho-CoA synthase [Enterocloster clostridioformis]|uniref:triphosphoribosyl-dephospho-CoA synthase n=1 Tax=Enterocloster clostridioformis TaxID=1531 RepID=UPI002480D4B6|nr:triphosphoribosyl-dephospho-CoA synthase [Enterocloster clostridioformis]MDB2130983.1 triphosphoribosyl-dephospho-CoA synthase [Enterocloster clostridioformis]